MYGNDVCRWSRPLEQKILLSEQKILFGAPYLRGLSGGDRMLIVCCVVCGAGTLICVGFSERCQLSQRSREG